MESKTVKMNYCLKYGGIEEVLEGNGQDVENYEDLYCSAKGQLVVIPKIIGVHQKIDSKDIDEISELENKIASFAQEFVRLSTGRAEGICDSLIALVYDPQVFTHAILKEIMAGKDVLNRLYLADYAHVPKFEDKPIGDPKKLLVSIDGTIDESTRKGALKSIEKQLADFSSNLNSYGLTRLEALNYQGVKKLLNKIEESNPQTKSGVTYRL